jgi:hypothetical protein
MRRTTRTTLAVLASLLLLAAACATRAERNLERCCGLELGMSRADVVQRLGRPDRTEAYLVEGEPQVYLFYLTRDLTLPERQRGQPPRETDYTPFLFVDDALQGWGACLYHNLRQMRPEPAEPSGRGGAGAEGGSP